MDLTEWTLIPTFGTQNCGIYTHKEDPTILLKCENRKAPSEKFNNAYKLQEAGALLFPKIIDWKIIDGKQYTTMERFDGDVTHLFTERIPNDILNDKANEYTEEQKKEIKELINAKLHRKITPSLNEFTTTKSVFDSFMIKLFDIYSRVYPDILRNMCIIRLKLFMAGYKYGDNKQENYGYTLNPPRIVFLDWDSGLFPITKEVFHDLDSFLQDVNNGMDFSVFHEGGKFSNMFSRSISSSKITNPVITAILSQSYKFTVPTYNFKTVSDVEVFVGLTPPLLLRTLYERGYFIENPIKTEQKRRGVPEIDYVNNNNKTQLMVASEFNILEEVGKLLKMGANSKIDINGITAMSLAIQNYNRVTSDTTEIIKLLLRNGAQLPKKIERQSLFEYILFRKSELPFKVGEEFVGINLPFLRFLAENGMSLIPLLQSTTDAQIQGKLLEIILSNETDPDVRAYITPKLDAQIKEVIVLMKTKRGGAKNKTRKVRRNHTRKTRVLKKKTG